MAVFPTLYSIMHLFFIISTLIFQIQTPQPQARSAALTDTHRLMLGSSYWSHWEPADVVSCRSLHACQQSDPIRTQVKTHHSSLARFSKPRHSSPVGLRPGPNLALCGLCEAGISLGGGFRGRGGGGDTGASA